MVLNSLWLRLKTGYNMVKQLAGPTVSILLDRIDQLNDRVQTHGNEFRVTMHEIRTHQHSNKEELLNKIQENKEELLKKIQDVELGYIKADGATNVKIASISATVAFVVSLLMILFKSKFGL